MRTSLSYAALGTYTTVQLMHFFPDGEELHDLNDFIETALKRMAKCFAANNNKYFWEDGTVIFNHLHSDQYAMFLYFLANSIYRERPNSKCCNKLFCLNKCLHGLNVYYAVELPDVFFLSHPLGTVLGRAKYSNYLMVYQGCTIGNNHGHYPTIGEHVTLYAGSSVLGNCNIGSNSKISAHSLLLDTDLPPNSIYIGTPSNFVIKENKKNAHVWK